MLLALTWMRILFPNSFHMGLKTNAPLVFLATSATLVVLHWPLLHLPYFWDEAGYYVPAALDFYRHGLLIPTSTEASGHTPLVMIYLGIVWHVLGHSVWAARAAMTLFASATVTSIYVLGRRVACLEIAAWSALLLALSPLFFAQSTLVHLDLAAGLFTAWAVIALLDDRLWGFALSAALALMSKETAVVLLPVAWLYTSKRKRGLTGRLNRFAAWVPLGVPLVPLLVWAVYYHHATGFWTGNRDYLTYNVYSTLSPVRIFWSLLRRVYELFVGGFNWMLTAAAGWGLWWGRRHARLDRQPGGPDSDSQHLSFSEPRLPSRASFANLQNPWRDLIFLTAGLVGIYLLLLSVVGGAILPRYLLPVIPLFVLVAVGMATRLPRLLSRVILATIAGGFVWAWFMNPPYPFPFEDNLAYADFITLHQQAAHYLEAQPPHTRILTAWPATDELTKPYLGYVQKPLQAVSIPGFAAEDLRKLPEDSFDLLYLYSRRWEPPGNWVTRFPSWLHVQGKYFDYQPQADAQWLAGRHHLRLRVEMERRGQWVRIYSR